MNIEDKQKTCDLCGQTIEITGFILRTTEGQKSFCCAGCQSIYQLLNEHILVSTQQSTNKK